jgi:hypothetical protein
MGCRDKEEGGIQIFIGYFLCVFLGAGDAITRP